MKRPGVYFRPAVFICDEYQAFATEDDPSGDEKSALTPMPLSRLSPLNPFPRYAPSSEAFALHAPQRIFLSLSDDVAKIASEMCGQVAKIKGSYTISETSKRAGLPALSAHQIFPGATRGRVSPARLHAALELSSDLPAL